MTNKTGAENEDASYIPADLAIQAMRDNGYKNTAYALAELVDNSVQAQAQQIEIICLEEMQLVNDRQRLRMMKIAVLDNGLGMSSAVLRKALQFGNGTRLNDRSGIGRFGMGLPNASISQATRVDVWSWQNGADNALHTFLDVEMIRQKKLKEVPVPNLEAVPKEWRSRADKIGKTGTLVVWSHLGLDRMTWKGSKATLRNVGTLLGRIHRRFIQDKSLRIRLAGGRDGSFESRDVTVNDPMYLTPAPHMPPPFNNEPMFERFLEEPIVIEVNGVQHTVRTTYSLARSLTLDLAGAANRGDTAYGKDAAENTGVSVMRAGRELMLDRSWTIQYDPRDRWWGCEVDFPAELDEIFGVTNNKQAATVFNELSALDWKELAEPGETLPQVTARLREEGDPKGVLLSLSETIKRNLRLLREQIKDQGRARGQKRKRHADGDPTENANEKWKERDKQVPIPGGDAPPTEDDVKDISEDLQDVGAEPEEVEEMVARVISGDLKVLFVDKALGGSGELFTVLARGHTTEVIFNRRHPAFGMIFDTVNADDDLDSLSSGELQDRLVKATEAVRVLFIAWARMEREDPTSRTRYERVRENWGKLARDFLEPLEFEADV